MPGPGRSGPQAGLGSARRPDQELLPGCAEVLAEPGPGRGEGAGSDACWGAASEAQACRNRRGRLLQVSRVSAGLGLALRPEKQRWEGNTHMDGE